MIENNKDKVSLIVGKILRETQEGLIKWDMSYSNDCFDIQDDDDTRIIGNIYIAKVANKNIRLYQLKKRYEIIDYKWIDQGYSVFKTPSPKKYKWTTVFQLEFYNASTKRDEWVFPHTNAISDLYEIVRKQTAGVDDFFSQYLNEKEEE